MLQQQVLPLGDPAWAGPYRLTARLGEGGQGVVYLAVAPTGEQVVVKLLRAAALRDAPARARLAREVSAARTVARFCTAQVLAADLAAEVPYVVSEYVPGPTLAALVRWSGPLTGGVLDRLAVGTATALAAIHAARIVHRDVKPGNVVLGPDGPRVIDFGIAHDLAGDAAATVTMLGTPAFTAPEQIVAGPVGPAADLFAWGCTMTFAATGRSPFEAGSPIARLHRVLHTEPDLGGVPPPLADVVRHCLAKDPAHRPTAGQVLGLLLHGTRDGAPPPHVAAPAAPGEDTQYLGAVEATTALADLPPSWAGPVPRPPDPTEPRDDPADGAGTTPRRRLAGRGAAAVLLAGALAGTAWWAAGGTHRPAAPAPAVVARPAVTAAAPVVPVGFAGSWGGQVAQPAGARHTFPVRLRLPDGAAGGDLSLPSLGCTARVDVVAPAGGPGLALVQRTTADPRHRCAPSARITLTPVGDGTLAFAWQDTRDLANTATATLART